MPIRINLKELFGSDPQSVTVDKINFNFNKLLELGIGLPGPKGLTGPQGSAGPQGLTGQPGTRGTLWFIGAGDPNLQTFTGLLDEDFYLDTTNSEIWQYNEGSGLWTLLIDFGSIITDYLITSGAAFVRGLGETSPTDDRFIVFPFRGNNSTAQVADLLGGSSQNDILFLNNFNEKFNVVDIDNFPTNTNELYTAIQKIFTDSTSGIPGRYHLELGSLFADSNGPNNNILSSLKHNLKVRHVVDDLGGGPTYPSSNSYLYIGRISLSKTELQSITELDYNSVFEFVTAKYNNEGVGPINRELTVRIGSTEAIGEYVNSLADGVNINLSNSEGTAEFGIVRELSSNRLDINGGRYLMINHDGNLEGIVLNQAAYQDGGNIEQLGSTGADISSSLSYALGVQPSTSASNVFHNLGITSFGNRLYTVEGVTPEGSDIEDVQNQLILWTPQSLNSTELTGAVWQWNIQDGDPVYNTQQTSSNGISSRLSPPIYFTGAGLCDIAVDGKYAYIVHNQVNLHLAEVAIGSDNYYQTNLQIVELDYAGQFVRRLNPGNSLFNAPGSLNLDGAWRIKLMGDLAVIGANKCRAFGSSFSQFNTINEDCKISLVNISDPSSPRFGALESSINLLKSHVLDMDIYENYIITVELEFLGLTAPQVLTQPYVASGGHRVTVNMYEISETFNGNRSIDLRAKSIVFSNTSTPITSSNFNSQTALNKTASVSTDGRVIYVSYIDKVYIYHLDDDINWIVPPAIIPIISTFTYTSRTGGIKVYDSKVAGNTLYLLNGNAASGSNDQQFRSNTVYLTKINISDKSNCYVEWEETVTNGGTRLEIVGGKAYIASQTFPNGSNYKHGIVTFDLDSIKTDHASISNLRSDHSKVMMDLEVGNNAKVYGSMSIGDNLKVQRNLYATTLNAKTQPRVDTNSLISSIANATFNAANSGIYKWQAAFSSGQRTANITNLAPGSSVYLYLRNTGSNPTTVTIQANDGSSPVPVNLSKGGQASVTSVALDPTSGTATVWVANVDGTFVGAVY